MLQRKRPTAVGNADYYGVVANTAARVMSRAKPGQVLVEANLPFTRGDPTKFSKKHTVQVGFRGMTKVAEIELHPHGTAKLKGLEKATHMFEVRLAALLGKRKNGYHCMHIMKQCERLQAVAVSTNLVADFII